LGRRPLARAFTDVAIGGLTSRGHPDFAVNDFDICADGSELILNKVEDNSDMALIERSRYAFSFGR
jgi:hypothetical protein